MSNYDPPPVAPPPPQTPDTATPDTATPGAAAFGISLTQAPWDKQTARRRALVMWSALVLACALCAGSLISVGPPAYRELQAQIERLSYFGLGDCLQGVADLDTTQVIGAATRTSCTRFHEGQVLGVLHTEGDGAEDLTTLRLATRCVREAQANGVETDELDRWHATLIAAPQHLAIAPGTP